MSDHKDPDYMTAFEIMHFYGVCKATAYNYLSRLAPAHVKYAYNPRTGKKMIMGYTAAIRSAYLTTRAGNPRCKDPGYQAYVASCRWHGRLKEPDINT